MASLLKRTIDPAIRNQARKALEFHRSTAPVREISGIQNKRANSSFLNPDTSITSVLEQYNIGQSRLGEGSQGLEALGNFGEIRSAQDLDRIQRQNRSRIQRYQTDTQSIGTGIGLLTGGLQASDNKLNPDDSYYGD